MKTIEQLEKENAELKLALGIAQSFPVKVRMECRKLIKSGSFGRDFISILLDSSNRAISKTPAQHLTDIKADAVEDAAKSLFSFGEDVDHKNKLEEYANKLRGESE